MSASAQPNLFPTAFAPPLVSGLTCVSEAIGADDEQRLARFVASLDFKPFEFRGFIGNRRTASFGWRYDFNGGGFQRADAMPGALQHAREIVTGRLGLTANDFEQCSVIEYAPGAGIGWHKDRPHFGKVAGVSLLTPCRLRLRCPRDGGGWERAAVLLEPRSAYLLDGEVRNVWQHSIPALERLRYSITFRTLAC